MGEYISITEYKGCVIKACTELAWDMLEVWAVHVYMV